MSDKIAIPPILDHDEALQLACMKSAESNLARCYIERTKMWTDALAEREEAEQSRAINHAAAKLALDQRDALNAEVERLRARVATLEQDADALVEGHVKVTVAGLTQQAERMTAALEWYANALGNSKSMDYRIITQDGGKRAREALSAPGAPPDVSCGMIEDGFGNSWSLCKPGCRMQIVRPGRVQCECDHSRFDEYDPQNESEQP